MAQKRPIDFPDLPIGEHLYFVYYPIIFYQWIKIYTVERMDIGKIPLTN